MATAADALTLEIATPLGLRLSVKAESVQAPSVSGEFGVLPGHLPLLGAIAPGVVKYRSEGKDHVVAIGAGFVKARPAKVLLLSDDFATPEEIVPADAQKELESAEKRAQEFPEAHEGAAFDEIERAVQWARAKLDCYALANA